MQTKLVIVILLLLFPLFLFALTLQNVSNKEINLTKFEKIKIINSNNIVINFPNKFEGRLNLYKFCTIKNSKNITLKNLYINSSNFPNCIVKIKKIDKKDKLITLKPINNKEENYCLNNIKNLFKLKIIYLASLKDNRISRKVMKLKFIKNFIFKYKSLDFNDKNNTYLLNFRYKSPVFSISNSKNIYLKSIFLNTSHNIVYLLKNDKNIYIDKVIIKDTFNRKITSNADIFHCPNIKGDFVLKNSYFEYVSDDIANIYSKALEIECNSGKCELNKKYDLKKGDKLYFYDIKIAELETATINKVKNNKIFLNKKLNTSKNIQVYLENRVNVLIKNNIFKNSRRFGVLIRNYGSTVIKNNIFENLSGDAITFFNSPKNKEGLFSQNILIENNVIKNVALGIKSKAAISIYALKKNWQKVKYTKNFFKNIQINNNKNENSKSFFIKNSQSIKLNN